MAYSVFYHREIIWSILKKRKKLVLSVTEKNKNIADRIIKRLNDDGMIYNTEMEGPSSILIKGKTGEKNIIVYQYKIKISASFS